MAARFSRSESATDVPPNFITTVPMGAMVEQDRRRRLRRLLAAAGALMAIAAVVLLAVDPFGDDGTGGDVPEAGSRFGAGEEQSVLEALGPVVATKPAAPAAARRAGGRAALRGGLRGDRAAARDAPHDAPARVGRGDRRRDELPLAVAGSRGGRRARRRGAARAAGSPARRHGPGALGDLGPPPAPDIGFDGTPAEARAEALDAARRLRSAHVRMVLGPAADLAVGGGPAEERGFSDDLRDAATFVEAAVRGWKEARVVVAPGRFPGEGAASQDPLFGPATVGLSTDELSRRDVEPFRGAVRGGADAVQMSAALYAAWDGVTPATVLPEAVRFLRTSTGFDGAVVSADLVATTAATGGGVARAAVEALKAGCDLLVLAGGPAEQEAAYQGVLAAVQRGDVPRERLDEAVRRVGALKAASKAD